MAVNWNRKLFRMAPVDIDVLFPRKDKRRVFTPAQRVKRLKAELDRRRDRLREWEAALIVREKMVRRLEEKHGVKVKRPRLSTVRSKHAGPSWEARVRAFMADGAWRSTGDVARALVGGDKRMGIPAKVFQMWRQGKLERRQNPEWDHEFVPTTWEGRGEPRWLYRLSAAAGASAAVPKLHGGGDQAQAHHDGEDRPCEGELVAGDGPGGLEPGWW